MKDLQTVLEISASQHDHLCPRQILGARIGLAGLAALGFAEPPAEKRLLTILETDGCFADGVIAATGCTVGHRTLRMEDYGKVAATFVDVQTGRAVRIAPTLDIREQARLFASEEPQRYTAQMNAYQTMPDDKMMTATEVSLTTSVAQLISRPGCRVNCAQCGEEIMNEREVFVEGQALCRACARPAYYASMLK